MAIKTTTTWSSVNDSSSLDAERAAWVESAIASGKTEDFLGTPQLNDDLSFDRIWVDQAAADEWKQFIEALAVKYGNSVTVTTVEV